MKLFSGLLVSSAILLLSACRQSGKSENGNEDSTQKNEQPAKPVIPETRTEVKKEAIAEYSEKTDNPLNNWFFKVQLYETQQTFFYKVKLEFEEIEGTDTIRFPDFGMQPKPVLKKGEEKYSCIIGFLDPKNEFREYKLVHVKNGNQLKLTPLRHYAMYMR